MAKIYIETYGCTFNQAESIYMAKILEKKGHTIVNNPETAEVVIINSCTVKQKAETKLYKAIRKYEKDKKVIIGGCVPQAEPTLIHTKLKKYSIIGPNAINRVEEAVRSVIRGKRFVDISNNRPNRLSEELIVNIPNINVTEKNIKEKNAKRKNVKRRNIREKKVTGIVPINDGCNAYCYFCKTKQSRGDLVSYSPRDIRENIQKIVKRGVKEIFVTSQDTGAYGIDIGLDLVELLSFIKEMEEKFYVRIGMMNPNHAYRLRKKLSKLIKDRHFYSFLHMSVQSGSNKVLREMNRPHNVAHFVKSALYYRDEVPDITIATDIIVGYPTENEEDFEETIKMIERVRPNVVNLSRYWPRPGTVAAKLKQLDSKVVKERMKIANRVITEIIEEENKKWKGWEGEILINEYGKNNSLKGRNKSYKQIVIKETAEMGSFINVKVYKTSKTTLYAKKQKK